MPIRLNAKNWVVCTKCTVKTPNIFFYHLNNYRSNPVAGEPYLFGVVEEDLTSIHRIYEVVDGVCSKCMPPHP